MEVIKDNENTDQEWDLSRNHWKSRTIWVVIFSFFNAFLGYRIGKGWNVLKYCLASSNFYIDYFWSFIFLSLMVYWTVQVTAYLDTKHPWKDEFLLRLLVQLLFGFLPSILFLEVVDHLYLQVTERSLFRITQNIIQFPFFLGLSLIYTLFYSLISLYNEFTNSINGVAEDLNLSLDEKRLAHTGNDIKNTFENNPVVTIREGKDIRMNDLDIVWVSNSSGMNLIYERNYDNPPIQDGHPLKYWVERLEPRDYYQVSRWDLVHRDIIKGYVVKPDKNFKIDLDYPGEHQLVLNKDKIDDFSKWFLKEF